MLKLIFVYLLFLFNVVYSQNPPNVIVFCDASSVYYQHCAPFDNIIVNAGFNRILIDDRPLTDSDFIGIDVFLDATLETASDCGSAWQGTTIQAIQNYMFTGGHSFFRFENELFNSCNDIKLNIVNQFITDSPLLAGFSTFGTCVMTNTLPLGKECILNDPNPISDLTFSCAAANDFYSTIDVDSTLALIDTKAMSGIWGPGDVVIPDSRIVIHSELNSNSAILENFATYLQNGCCNITSECIGVPCGFGLCGSPCPYTCRPGEMCSVNNTCIPVSTTPSATITPTASETATQTGTQTQTGTGTQTPSQTQTQTGTQSGTPSSSSTPTPSNTETSSGTSTPTSSNSPTTTASSSLTPSSTPTPTSSITSSITASNSITQTASGTSTDSNTVTPTNSMTPTSTQSESVTSSVTPTVTSTGTQSGTPSVSESFTPSNSATQTGSNSPSSSMTGSSTTTITSNSTQTLSGTASLTSSATPTSNSTISGTSSSSISPTSTISASSSQTTTPSNSNSVSDTPTQSLTTTPTSSQSATPSFTVSPTSSNSVSESGTNSPTVTNTNTPTSLPSLSSTQTQSITSTVTSSTSITITEPTTNSPTVTPSPSSSPSPSISTSPTTTGTDTPSMSITETSTVSPTSSISESIQSLTPTPTMTTFIDNIAAPDAPSQEAKLSNSRSLTSTPSSSLSRSFCGGCVTLSPTQLAIDSSNNNGGEIFVSSDNGEIVASVLIPPGFENDLPPGSSLRVLPVKIEDVQGTRIGSSSAIDVTLIDINGNELELPTDVELCFDVNKSEDFDDACLGYIDENGDWICEDKCIDENNDGQLCGETSHFTSFAILLDGGNGDGDCGSEDGLNEVILYLSIASVAVAICLIFIMIIIIELYYQRKIRKAQTKMNTLKSRTADILRSSTE